MRVLKQQTEHIWPTSNYYFHSLPTPLHLLATFGCLAAPQHHLLGIKQRATHPPRLEHHHLPRLHGGDALLALAEKRPGAAYNVLRNTVTPPAPKVGTHKRLRNI